MMHKQKVKLANRKYYIKNRERLIMDTRRYRKKNKIKIARRRKIKYQNFKNEILQRNKKYRIKNSKKLLEQKRLYRLKKMGLSIFEVEKAKMALRNHKGICEICGSNKPKGMGGWLIDHNHKTKKFRGILCTKCNALLGFVKDNFKILKSAIIYLQIRA